MLKYGDGKISEKEIMIAVASIVIGGGILTLPKSLAEATTGSDGWISLAIAGLFFVFFTWMVATLAARFPHQSFYTYASLIVTKPVAIILTCLYGILYLSLSSYVIRNIAGISKNYLLQETPVEVIALAFLLVVVYAVSASRVGVIRLNMLFLPIIIFVAIFILLFNLNVFDVNNLLPVFKTSLAGYVKGFKTSVTSFLGFGVILFYTAYLRNPKKGPKAVAIGMCIPTVLYLLIYITSLGVFGHAGTANLVTPLIELAKRAEIPGMLLERIESLFFVIWLMAIFTSAVMAFDVAVLAINSILRKTAKIKIILTLVPIQYYISMFPQDFIQVSTFGEVLSYILIIFTISVTILLIAIAKVRGVKGSE